ncbi:SDR family NAD(P)-dependent oxidoreductase [Paraglaciecola sp.]|uniref:SDR family NAD(P)-dependent oxidoreductase n=1 Tax=Paraglaciecola sp. TaxID=1920173 RepID=UPI003EF41EB4
MSYQTQLFDLTAKRIVVTGANRVTGIGAAIAQGLVNHGAEVVIHGRENTTESQQVLTSLKKVNPKCELIIQDLAEQGAGKSLIEKIEQQGPIDVLVTNHSLQVLGPFAQLSQDQINQQMQLNFTVNVEMLQSLLPLMAKRNGGRIINVGSVNQDSPKAIVSVYAAMKAAQHNLLKGLAQEYAAHGILMNSIAPGLVDTYPENRAGDEQACQEWDEYAKQLNWLGRAGNPEEIAGAAVFLASSASSFMTGETLNLTGGF